MIQNHRSGGGHADVVDALLRDPRTAPLLNAANEAGVTPLRTAVISNHAEVVRRLLREPSIETRTEALRGHAGRQLSAGTRGLRATAALAWVAVRVSVDAAARSLWRGVRSLRRSNVQT